MLAKLPQIRPAVTPSKKLVSIGCSVQSITQTGFKLTRRMSGDALIEREDWQPPQNEGIRCIVGDRPHLSGGSVCIYSVGGSRVRHKVV